jgi:hypothetical protein
MNIRKSGLILMLTLAASLAQAEPRRLSLTLQPRDPKSNQVTPTTEDVDSAKVAVVIVDPWNYHWRMTAWDPLLPRSGTRQGCKSLVPVGSVSRGCLGDYHLNSAGLDACDVGGGHARVGDQSIHFPDVANRIKRLPVEFGAFH